MTYQNGPFYVTTVVMENSMFAYANKPNKHPSTLAAFMTSTTKERNDYEFFGKSLSDFGIKTLTYATDGECAMETGMEKYFPIEEANIHLRCFDHVNNDMKNELQNLVSDTESERIRKQILGFEFNGTRTNGLVDCENGEEFDLKYEELSRSWPRKFLDWSETNKGKKRSLKDCLKLNMLKPIRTAAGLGDPPNKYVNQRVESMNTVIKEAANNQRTDQVSIHEMLKSKIFDQQEREYIKAVYGMGEYRLSTEFKKYEVDPLVWCKKTAEQRRKHLQALFRHPRIERDRNLKIKSLSISVEDCGIECLPSHVLSDIWNRAETTIFHFQVIPLVNNSFCVPGFNGSKDVTVNHSRYNCNRPQFIDSGGICHHCVVVAEYLGSLDSFLLYFIANENSVNKAIAARVAKAAGEQRKVKKPRRGRNRASMTPIIDIMNDVDTDLDFSKPFPSGPKQIWHNHNDVYVVKIKDYAKTKKNGLKCETCNEKFTELKTCLKRGKSKRCYDIKASSVSHDICIMHQEQYLCPKYADKAKTQFIGMKESSSETPKFYCVKKNCILTCHPYFWKGRLRVEDEVKLELEESDLKLIKGNLHKEVK